MVPALSSPAGVPRNKDASLHGQASYSSHRAGPTTTTLELRVAAQLVCSAFNKLGKPSCDGEFLSRWMRKTVPSSIMAIMWPKRAPVGPAAIKGAAAHWPWRLRH
ncbi:hypothetical protein B296_00048007 [Ensete ventricosum]|uniref:Uncharacterized protein n=1 Tax=Ensete ventricosum TaxID=4639 RepID=A0A426X564_ENSVE|nr:hypothetical protein B296_00048007 [Ensete ventricosum]